MPDPVPSLRIWQNVPPKSVLEFAAEPAGGTVQFNVRVLADRNGTVTETVWGTPVVAPGPKTLKLAPETVYVLRVRIGFVAHAETDAAIHARIVKPDGEQHGEAYDYPASGQNGDTPARATIIIRVAK